jgi:hypothetical protein
MHGPHRGPPLLVGPRRCFARSQLGGSSVLWNGNRSLDRNGPETRKSAGRKIWCRRRDLNPHGLRHTPLKRACLPFHHFGTWQELEKPPQLRTRVAQPSTYRREPLGCRNHLRDFSVRQDPSKGRTAHTMCDLYLLGLSLAAALLQGFLKLLQQGMLK